MGNSTAIDPPLSADPTTNGAQADGDRNDLVTALLPSRAPLDTPRAVEQAAPEWEYRTELLEHGFLGWGSEQVDLRKLQDRLDTLGPQGWELVHVSWNHRVRRKHGGHLLIFKRPKPDG
jgi:Domain of unknown function (DUF4177)